MKSFLRNFRKSSGFTLVELLVVIAIIGILAAALLAAIDPVEQINKARDTRLQTTANQFVGASTAFFASDETTWRTNCANFGTTPVALSGTAPAACIGAMVTSRELKASFNDDAPSMAAIFVRNDSATAADVTGSIACFRPVSRAARAQGRWTDANGTTACVPSATTICWWCAR